MRVWICIYEYWVYGYCVYGYCVYGYCVYGYCVYGYSAENPVDVSQICIYFLRMLTAHKKGIGLVMEPLESVWALRSFRTLLYDSIWAFWVFIDPAYIVSCALTRIILFWYSFLGNRYEENMILRLVLIQIMTVFCVIKYFNKVGK